MSEQLNETLESLERLKEVERLRFDYFKQLSTLSTGSIGAIIAFIAKIFPASIFINLAAFSLFCFFICLVGSLFGMTAPGNMILYLTSIQTIGPSSEKTPEEREKDIKTYSKRYLKGLNEISILDKITKWAFVVGVISFLFYAGMSLWKG